MRFRVARRPGTTPIWIFERKGNRVATAGSKKVIYAALVGNSLIAVTKFTASYITGSSAMLSEAVHSLVDTGNQWLLLYGIKRARQPADMRHPFGYAMEEYFWAFIVAILIFGLGAGISFYEGLQRVLDPHEMGDPTINYVVLGLAMVFEGGSWWVAFREFRRSKGKRGWVAEVRHSKDPTKFTVLFEDSAAMLGLVVALAGIAAAQRFELPVLDGVAAIAIGAILAVTAGLLAFECKGLLIGEAASPAVVLGIRQIIGDQAGVKGTNEVLTMHLGPADVLANLSIDFEDGLSSEEVEQAVSLMERAIKAAHPEVTRVFIEVQSVKGHVEAGRP